MFWRLYSISRYISQAGEKHNYHAADSFALSVLVFELTGKSVAQIFYDTVFKRFKPNGQMHWVADNMGRTVSQARLVMTAPDWVIWSIYN